MILHKILGIILIFLASIACTHKAPSQSVQFSDVSSSEQKHVVSIAYETLSQSECLALGKGWIVQIKECLE